MRLKNYLLINGHAVKVGINMDRVFPSLAGKRVPWFSIVHYDKVTCISDIVKVYFTYAYYDLDGKLDLQQHEQEATQKPEKLLFPVVQHLKNEKKNVLSMRHRVKMPRLTDDEYKSLQKKVSKDLGFIISINLLLQTVL
jgi:hypothetical protein